MMLTNLFVLMLVFTSTICECTFHLHLLDMRQDLYTYSWYTGYKLSGIASHIEMQIIEVYEASLTARAKNSDALVAAAAYPRACRQGPNVLQNVPIILFCTAYYFYLLFPFLIPLFP